MALLQLRHAHRSMALAMLPALRPTTAMSGIYRHLRFSNDHLSIRLSSSESSQTPQPSQPDSLGRVDFMKLPPFPSAEERAARKAKYEAERSSAEEEAEEYRKKYKRSWQTFEDGSPMIAHSNWFWGLPPPPQTEGSVFEVAHEGVRTIVLNRIDQKNALNLDMIRQIYPRLVAYQSNEDIKAIVVHGVWHQKGTPSFCAGGDVMALYKNRGKDTETFFREQYTLNFLTATLQTPYICLLNGITMGGGVGLSALGKYRIATADTVFAMPETAIGFFPDVGATHFLPRLNGHLGMYLALTGHRLKGVDVVHAGIATHYMAHDYAHISLHDALEESAPGNEAVGAVVDGACDWATAEETEFSLAPHLEEIDKIFSRDSVEDILDALQQSRSHFGKQTLKAMRKASPLSLKVTFRALRQGKYQSLEENFRTEFRLSQRFMKNPDFFEGVRALLVDGDNAPKWKPARIQDVTDAMVDSYFAPLRADEPKELELSYLGNKPFRTRLLSPTQFFQQNPHFDFWDPNQRQPQRLEPEGKIELAPPASFKRERKERRAALAAGVKWEEQFTPFGAGIVERMRKDQQELEQIRQAKAAGVEPGDELLKEMHKVGDLIAQFRAEEAAGTLPPPPATGSDKQ